MESEKPCVSHYVRYVAVREQGSKRVILPAIVATECKLFSELFSALYATELHVRGSSDGLFSSAPLDPVGGDGAAKEGEAYLCCCASSPSLLPLSPGSRADATSAAVLEVRLPCLEYETLSRMAEFVVRKAVMTDGPAEAASVSVLRDLDAPSGENQYKAVQLLLGSDFLGC